MPNLFVLQIEDRKDNPFIQELLEQNRNQCITNGIQYQHMELGSHPVPPYWAKVFELEKIMLQNPHVDYVMWIDSDAFLLNFSKSKLDKLLATHSDSAMIITGDMPPWEQGEFNAGCFIIKNNEIGLKIIAAWRNCYNKYEWSFEGGNKWSTKSVWGGPAYEQGAFISKILTNDLYVPSIVQLPYTVLNNNSCSENTDSTIVTHLAGEHKEDKEKVAACRATFSYSVPWIQILVGICLLCVCLIILMPSIRTTVYQTIRKIGRRIKPSYT
jgi:hypothetical protein